MKRTRITLAALALAMTATACSSISTSSPVYSYAGGAGDGLYRPNVGTGDALGAALFGKDVTLARAKQFSDTEYATVDDTGSIGDQ